MRHRQIIIEKHANSFVIILNKWRTDNNTNLEIKSSVLQKRACGYSIKNYKRY